MCTVVLVRLDYNLFDEIQGSRWTVIYYPNSDVPDTFFSKHFSANTSSICVHPLVCLAEL